MHVRRLALGTALAAGAFALAACSNVSMPGTPQMPQGQVPQGQMPQGQMPQFALLLEHEQPECNRHGGQRQAGEKNSETNAHGYLSCLSGAASVGQHRGRNLPPYLASTVIFILGWIRQRTW